METTKTDLVGVTIGFNRGLIITDKVKQQVDVDQLYEREHFEIERSVGQLFWVDVLVYVELSAILNYLAD